MSRLNRIQNEIKQLEGGRFQKLCDNYLYRKRSWGNIVSLGSMEGTDKTTKGIPDTYFFDDEQNSYILIMYGTRKDSTAKLESDIIEAIEKTKIDKKDIQEIICCHTSSNLTVRKDKELKKLADSIKLTLIGIDTLSHDLLQLKYQDIVKDFLGIIESTEQVWNIEQFISIHDKSKTNAPLDTSYIDETRKIEGLIEEINGHQILLLYGISGTGKTRLAIELCKELCAENNVICVKSNSMPVYQDIKDALDNNQVNYLFLDDANTISNFDAIVNLLRLEEYEHNLKIIMTVRDYALSGIINQLEFFKTKIQKVSLMSDEEIELLINSINQFSPNNFRNIMKLSHNNPRIAVIAAKMVKEQKYEFINNEKEILGSYYDQIIKENALSQSEKVSLFILSFKRKLNLTDQQPLEELLKFFKLDLNEFLVALNQLHDKELCDIFQDKATRISDQSLADFVIIDFIANNKIFKVRDFFINLFPRNAKEIVEMLILVNNFQLSNDWIDYLTDEIKYVYNEIISDFNKEHFLTQYGVLIPIETLAYISEKIQHASSIVYQASQEEFEEKKRNNRVDDPIIEILCSLSNSDKYNDAGILLMEYLKKRQDKVYEIFSAIKSNFDIEEDWNSYLEKRFSMFEIFSSQENINELTSLLIVNIAEKFLKFSDERYVSNDQGVVIRQYTLVDGDYLIKLHTKILYMLFKVYELNYLQVNNHIDKLLYNYPVYEAENGFLETISSDLKCIETLFFKDLKGLNIRQEAIVSKLNSEAKKIKLESQLFFEYEPSSKQVIYKVFSPNRLEGGFDYEKIQEIKVKKLTETFNNNTNDLLGLFDVLAEYQSDELLNIYELEESILLLYSVLGLKDRVKLLSALLNSDFNLLNFHFSYFMEKLPFVEGKNILNSIKKKIDESWYLSNMLTCKNINKDRIEELILFLKNLKSYETVNSFNIVSFESYIEKDDNILGVLWSKYEEGEILGRFFIPDYTLKDIAGKIINLLGYEELKEIYLDILGNQVVDRSGEVFKILLEEQDVNFIYSFLKKLNTLRVNSNYVECDIQLKHIWKSEVAEEGIRKYLDYLIRENRVIYVGVDQYLEKIFKANTKRAFEFMKNEVLDTEDDNKLVNLYNLSLEIFNDEVLLNLFVLLKDKGVDAIFIKKLNLTMRSHSWSGSLAPLLDKEISFLNKLLDVFKDVNYISLALVISTRIDSLKKRKEKELLSDYLE
ncbi:TPA_asm: hypothetical protein GYH79_00215 [Listeria monocytogenes]|nr:hypothetical protein [Listeria monocytogenes]